MEISCWTQGRKNHPEVMFSILFYSQFHVRPVLDLISTLNLLDLASLKLRHGGYLFDDEMMRQIWWNEGAYRKRSLSKVSGKSDFIKFELQNKQSPLSKYKSQWPQNTLLIFGSLVLIKRLFCFSRKKAGQVKSLYFKHWYEDFDEVFITNDA